MNRRRPLSLVQAFYAATGMSPEEFPLGGASASQSAGACTLVELTGRDACISVSPFISDEARPRPKTQDRKTKPQPPPPALAAVAHCYCHSLGLACRSDSVTRD